MTYLIAAIEAILGAADKVLYPEERQMFYDKIRKLLEEFE